MKFLKPLITPIIAIPFFTLPYTVLASSIIEAKCGNALFEVESNLDAAKYNATCSLFYKAQDKERELLLKPNGDHLSIACLKNEDQHDFLLIEEMCGGSGCTDDGVYTLIDADTRDILVKYVAMKYDGSSGKHELLEMRAEHEAKNHQQVEAILGYEPPYLPHSNDKYSMLINIHFANDAMKIKTRGAAKEIAYAMDNKQEKNLHSDN